MTCGIYKLSFTGTAKVYIGQSVNIEKRYKQHLLSLRSSTANYKLLEAYALYGIPTLDILIECLIEELSTNEDECIDIWNSNNLGLNIYSSAYDTPAYSGYGYGNSKYAKESIIEVFNLLVDTQNTFSSIANITDVRIDTISNIASCISHPWLKEYSPTRYKLLMDKKGSRANYTVVSDKLSAKSKGIVYPPICSPEGVIYYIDNAYKFAQEQLLAPNHFQEVLNGHRKSHKGWKLCPVEQVS